MILAYHRVNPWHAHDALSVRPEDFRSQMEYLVARKIRQTSVLNMRDGLHPACPQLAVTFDDGFADNYWFAFPVLKELGIPFLVFLTVNCINTLHIWPRYSSAVNDRFLTWDEIRTMAAEGAEFGSHTLSHPHLTRLPAAKAWEEVSGSRKVLEDTLGRPVTAFCYPYGEYSESVVEMVARAGYKAAVVTPSRGVRRTPLTLPRTGIYGHNDFLAFRIKVWKSLWRERDWRSFLP